MKQLSSFSCLATAALLLLGGATARAQAVVTIGTGTSAASTNALLSTSTTTNKYARTVSIYTAAELTAAGARAGNITKIYWYKDGAGEYPTADAQLDIYLKSNTTGTLSADPVVWATEVTGATKVFGSTTLSLPTGTGWKEFTFSTPYRWNGTDNVEVLVDWFRNSTPTADITWRYTAVGSTGGLHATQVNSVALTSSRWAANRPNVQLALATVTGTRLVRPGETAVQVAPNPFTDLLRLEFGLRQATQAAHVELVDALGRLCATQQLAAGAERHWQLPANLPMGLYSVRVRVADELYVIKLTRL